MLKLAHIFTSDNKHITHPKKRTKLFNLSFESKPELIDLEIFKDIPFLIMALGSDTREKSDAIYSRYNFIPNSKVELDQVVNLYSYAIVGVGAAIINDTVVIVGIMILYVGGARIWYLMAFAAVGLTGFVLAVIRDPVRWNRIKAFLDPEQYALTYSFQLLNAINAFIAGGITGVGLGGSIQKHYYLPEAHTDFIFAIIGEELGLAATLLVVLLFAGLFFCGLRISLRAADNFGRNMAFGITMMITLQALINIGVVIGCLPTKGLPLPFISAGGSSLIVSLLQIGILLNIAQQGREPEVLPERPAIKDRVHNF